MLRSDVFERMGFVEDDGIILGQDADVAAQTSQCEIGEEEGVIDDEDLRVLHVAASFEIEALAELRTLFAQAVARIALDQLPDGRHRAEIEIAAGAVFRRLGPLQQLVELLVRSLLRQQR